MESRLAGGLLVACVVAVGAAGLAFYSAQPTPAKLAEQIASLDLRENNQFSSAELTGRMKALVTLKTKFPTDRTVGPFAAETISRLRELGAPAQEVFDTIQTLDQFDWEQDDRDRLDSEAWFALISLRRENTSLPDPVDSMVIDFSRRLAMRYELTDFRIIDVLSTAVGWKPDRAWREEKVKEIATWRREPDYLDLIPYMELGLRHQENPLSLRGSDWLSKSSVALTQPGKKIVIRLNKDLDEKDERENYWGPLAEITKNAGALLVIASESEPKSDLIIQEAEGDHVRFAKVDWPAGVPDLPPALDGYFLVLDEGAHPHSATASLVQLQAILQQGSAPLAPPEAPRAQGLKGNPRTR
ncbi:MAG: hypothetical protein LCH41_01895 [Armatimonadetes bacterium]|nr:hypothetical protein [Armatimonadota bacterium]